MVLVDYEDCAGLERVGGGDFFTIRIYLVIPQLGVGWRSVRHDWMTMAGGISGHFFVVYITIISMFITLPKTYNMFALPSNQ